MLPSNQREYIGKLVMLRSQLTKLEAALVEVSKYKPMPSGGATVHVIEYTTPEMTETGIHIDLSSCFVANEVMEATKSVIQSRITSVSKELTFLIPDTYQEENNG